MTYATRAKMIERFKEKELADLTDRDDPRTNAIVDAVLAVAMNDAQAEVDEALQSAGYVVPVDPAPQRVVHLTCDIARYRLYQNLPPNEVKTEARIRYEDARKILDKIIAGEIAVDGAETADDLSAGGMAVSDRELMFGPEFASQFGGILPSAGSA